MTVTRCLQHWNTPKFEDAFLTELMENENDLPLESMCGSGGYPSAEEWAEITDLKIESTDDGLVAGSFAVSFTEESPTGCRDAPWTDRRNGRISFSLRLDDGYVEFEPPTLKREYDLEEF